MLNVSRAMSASAVKTYFQAGDYYIDGYNPPGVWGGNLAERLGLSGQVEKLQFDRMCDGLHPFTGEQLRPVKRDNARSANDITISAPKEVTLLYVRTGDERIIRSFNESCDEIMAIMEKEAATRVRIGGADEDRVTGNWSWAGYIHFEARPESRGMEGKWPVSHSHRFDSKEGEKWALSDPQLHRHHVVFNLTDDPVEKRIKALQIGIVKENADLYMPMFHNILAKRMHELGYGIERPKEKVGFGISGIPRELVEKFSRRRLTIMDAKKDIAKAQGITGHERLRRLQAELAVLTRKHKQKDLTREELWKSWEDRMSAADEKALDQAKGQQGWVATDAEALRYAVEHLFYRDSVVPEKKLLGEALRYGVGSVTLEGLKAEYNNLGVMVKNGEATTREVLAQEGRIIDFAREGKGTCRPMGDGLPVGHHRGQVSGDNRTPTYSDYMLVAGKPAAAAKPDTATLSPEQQAKFINNSIIPDKLDNLSPEQQAGSLFVSGDDDRTKYPSLSAEQQTNKPVGVNLHGRDTVSQLSEEQQDHFRDLKQKAELSRESCHDSNKHSPLRLSDEQTAICKHIWSSTDRVIMIEGDAGTGKTQTMQRTIPGIDKPGVFLAPSASASRGTLREKGFTNANTITMFLSNEKFRNQARNGYIYIDEAPLAGLADIDKVFGWAKVLNARVILQGDRKQHQAIARGNLFGILDKFAGLPIARLQENFRQRHKDYKSAVNAIAKGDILAGYDMLDKLGWVKHSSDAQSALVRDYLDALQRRKSVLIVAPTHKAGEAITDEIRAKLKELGRLQKNERTFYQLTPLHLTPVQKGDNRSYVGTEVLQFHRGNKSFKAGQRVDYSSLPDGTGNLIPEHFSAYAPGEVRLAVGDAICITNGGWSLADAGGKHHRLDNGYESSIAGFTEGGDIVLSNGWTVDKNFGHINHAYTTTSYGSQGKTVDIVLGAMGRDSFGAINAAQFYVTSSRGRDRFTLYSDLASDELRNAIQKSENRKSATELMGYKRKPPVRRTYIHSIRQMFSRLRERLTNVIQPTEQDYARETGRVL